MDTIRGGCFCGEVRYEICGEVTHSSVCHCSGCRRASGAPAVAWLTVGLEAFKVVRGELKMIRGRQGEAGTCDGCGGERGFCPSCGSQITFAGDDRKGEIDITTCSTDRPNDFGPKEDCWADQRLDWVEKFV